MIAEQPVYERPIGLTAAYTHYCPGCTHGIAHRLTAEVLEELGILGRTIGVASVGCSVFAYNYIACDFVGAAHGRAPAVATGLKRVLPDRIIFTYQGDGDLASIGLGEVLHAAARGECITVIFINNAIYGMTGGQMAPTSPAGMVTTSSPTGRDPRQTGHPVRVCELIAQMDGAAYVARRSLHNPAEIRRAKKALRAAFECQMNGRGFALVELLSTCPTNWGMTPVDALRWVEERMLPVFPLGEFKNVP
ncbi:MAG: thiamine pyrophosphate-dependent enzyme [Roseiflexus sp.]|nr:thiamine pyrophosphate-dependent enzyme [Roseiflexus sp.]MDW8147391.1 thiamine pyrophosphate-dependent enzyme [Roseiflexaceae bacterium]